MGVYKGRLYSQSKLNSHIEHIRRRNWNNEPAGAPFSLYQKYREWTFYVSQQEIKDVKQITIELRFDADEDDKHGAMQDAACSAARHLYSSALLISTKRKPQIAVYTSDMFKGTEDITHNIIEDN